LTGGSATAKYSAAAASAPIAASSSHRAGWRRGSATAACMAPFGERDVAPWFFLLLTSVRKARVIGSVVQRA
jgi:hypothetical protein